MIVLFAVTLVIVTERTMNNHRQPIAVTIANQMMMLD